MKLAILIISVFLMTAAFARDCEVFGISNGPQKLHCTFKTFHLALRCKGGTYYLNSSKVTSAYHLEVEYGAVPLVFKARDMKLTVVMDKVGAQAELLRTGRSGIIGSCL